MYSWVNDMSQDRNRVSLGTAMVGYGRHGWLVSKRSFGCRVRDSLRRISTNSNEWTAKMAVHMSMEFGESGELDVNVMDQEQPPPCLIGSSYWDKPALPTRQLPPLA